MVLPVAESVRKVNASEVLSAFLRSSLGSCSDVFPCEDERCFPRSSRGSASNFA